MLQTSTLYLQLTRQQEEEENHDGRVTKVEECGRRPFNLQLGYEVVDAVDEQVECGEPTGQETAPPPVIVLKLQKLSVGILP